MARHKHPKQLSQADMERFLADAERLHESIVGPLIAPTCDHYRSLQALHETLLKTVKGITGKDPAFIKLNLTGPVN